MINPQHVVRGNWRINGQHDAERTTLRHQPTDGRARRAVWPEQFSLGFRSQHNVGTAEREGDAELHTLLKLAQSQLEAIKKEITAAGNNPTATGAELFAVQVRLDEIEARLSTASAALVQVAFPTNGTTFKPSPAVVPTLVASARAADQINIPGRTDSRGAGPIDEKIALGRAMSAKRYLVAHGVDGNKIKVQSQGAGDYAAPNMTKAGRALNRRVEIEIVNARIAELRSRATKLARGPQ